MEDAKNMGFDVKKPSAKCNDRKCPFHGDLKVRGRVFTGIVVSALARNTAKVEWVRKHHLSKYERYEMRRTRISVHNPECINAQKDDVVRIAECRQLSKTKNFVIIEKIGKLEKVHGIDDTAKEKSEKQAEEAKKKNVVDKKEGEREEKKAKKVKKGEDG